MLTQAQVGHLLDVEQDTLRLYVEACRRDLSSAAGRRRGAAFTEADVAVLRRFQNRLAEERAISVSCAWCGREITIRPGGGVGGSSHGMCRRCAEAFIREYELERVAV